VSTVSNAGAHLSAHLSDLGAGFASSALASQRVFRAALEALARPGRIARVEAAAEAPPEFHPSSCALALALLDQDTRLWLSPSLRTGKAATYFRFHTGCVLATEAGQADFALAAATELPPLEAFGCGSEDYPDRSSTVVIQVGSLREGEGWRLSGPGIKTTARLAVGGLRGEFPGEWAKNRRLFPRGVDVFLACGSELCGLPRTTHIEA
jgi:alpha-D-ribose 1-methylphosphonate 5-triphosphate synthase subunit PhnH